MFSVKISNYVAIMYFMNKWDFWDVFVSRLKLIVQITIRDFS